MLLLLTLLANVAWNSYAEAQTFINEPSDTYVRAGRTIWWHCMAEFPDDGPVRYSWMFNGVPVPQSGPQHFIYNNGTLRLDVIQPENEGQYYCIADNGISRITSKQAQLTIAYISQEFNIQPKGQNPNIGQMVLLECAIMSQPPAEITWLHNDLPVPKDMVVMVSGKSQLTIQSVDYSDDGRYQCMGRNPLTGETKYSNTAVLTPKGGPVWSIEPEPQTVNKDSVLYLHCTAYGNPKPTISWYHVQGIGQETIIENDNRFVVFPNGTLRIADAKPFDGGFYKCQASNDVDTISKTVLITVSELPKKPIFTTSPTNLTVREGDTVNWFCAATGEPAPTVSWQRIGRPLVGIHISFPTPGSLRISPANREDRGWYICEAINPAGYNTTQAFLDVQYPPTIKQLLPSAMVVETGSRVHLPCIIDSNPKPEIRWIAPRDEITESPGVTLYPNGSLIIDPVSPLQMGIYTCEAHNYLNSVTQSIELQVTSKPVFLKPPSDVSANIETTAILDCLAVGYPTPIVSWILANNTKLVFQNNFDENEYITYNGSLIISSAEVTHEGTYTCIAENQLGTVSATASLRIQGPPVFERSQYSVIRNVGDSLLMDCNPSGRPEPVVQWAKDEMALVPDEFMEVFANNSLYIRNITQQHYGTYQCYAANQVGSARLEIDVLQPDSPVFTVRPADIYGNVSKPLQVECQAQSVLTPDISWYRVTQTGTRLIRRFNISNNVTDDPYVTESGTLVFVALSPDDEGFYKCTAANSMGNTTAQIFINVQVPPIITMVNTPTSGDIGMATTLICEAEGDPTPVIIWMSPRGQTIMYTNDLYIVEEGLLTIKITNIEEHMGTWMCKACNILGCDEKNIDLYIRGPPVIVSVEGRIEGTARVLTCHAEGTPYPEIRYYWGDLAINPLFPPRGHSISTDGPSLRIQYDVIDSVAYKCRATNQFGTDVREFRIPSAPYGLTLLSVGPRDALMTWFPPSMTGGLPELNYTIEYTMLIPGTNIQVVNRQVAIQQVPYRLANLEAYTQYMFRVAAYNILGVGPYTDPVSAQTQEDAPDPVEDLYLTFAGEVIHVTWQPPTKLNGQVNNIVYNVVASDALTGNIYDRITVKYGQPPETYLTDPKMYDHRIVVSVTAVNVGIGLSSKPVTEEFIVKHKVPFVAPFLTRAASLGPHTVAVQWTYPEYEGRDISGFYIRIMNVDRMTKMNEVRVNGYDVRQFNVDGLAERTSYGISVAAFSQEGKGPYSGEKIVLTGYEVFSEIPYLESQKLSISGTKLAIILGSISGILLFLVIVLLIWQWARLNRRIREKLIEEAYKEKPSPYPQVFYERGAGASRDVPPQYSRDKPKAVIESHPTPTQKEPVTRKSAFYKPKRRLYGPGRSFVYKVTSRGQASPAKRRIYKKQKDPEPIMAFSEIEVCPTLSSVPRDKGQRPPGHPANRRDRQRPPGQQSKTIPPTPHRPATQQPRLTASQENLANQKAQGLSPHTSADVRAARARNLPKRPQPVPEQHLAEKPRGKDDLDGVRGKNPPILSRLHEAHPLPKEGTSKSDPLSSTSHGEPIYAVPNKVLKGRHSPVARLQPGESQHSLVESFDNPESGYSSPAFPDVVLDRSAAPPITTGKGKHGGRGHAKNLGTSTASDSGYLTPDSYKLE